jgi:acetyl-CoA carboxylase biotin carboxyl carrier protein
MNKFDLDPDLVRNLAKLLDETGLTEIEYAEGDRRIRLNRQPAPAAAHTPVTVSVPAVAPAVTADMPSKNAVNSPMVGTVYLASEPGSAPFVTVGDRIAEGQTLVIIEAMKVMNPIRSPRTGTVAAILVEDAQPVEYGEPLVVID